MPSPGWHVFHHQPAKHEVCTSCQWVVGQPQLPFHSESCGWRHYQSKSNPRKQVHYNCQTKGRVPMICAAQMPPGSHQLQSTPSKPACSDLLHGSLPLHVFLVLLNGCCPSWSLSLEPLIVVGLSSLSLCSLHLHVMLQFLA